MTRYAKQLVADGVIGPVRLVQVEYIQSGLAKAIEQGTMTDSQRWKFDADRSGLALVFSAIGCHAQHLACNVSGLVVEAVSADVGALMPGRGVTDTVLANLRFAGGARAGNTRSRSRSRQRERHPPARLWRAWSPRLVTPQLGLSASQHRGRSPPAPSAGDAGLPPSNRQTQPHATRPPRRFARSLANLYRGTAEAIHARNGGTPHAQVSFPTIEDGVASMRFIEACIASHAANGVDGGLASFRPVFARFSMNGEPVRWTAGATVFAYASVRGQPRYYIGSR